MRKLILVIIIFAGCSKKEEQPLTSIKVLESITNLPVSGADVTLSEPYSATVAFQGVTDDNGICLVPSLIYNTVGTGMYVMKQKYWTYGFREDTTVHLTPYGWLQLRIHKVGNYTAGSRLLLTQFDQSGSVYFVTDVNTAEDSLIVAFCYGNQQTRIEWAVHDGQNPGAAGTIDWLQIPRFDTLKNVTLEY
jgi:hypothetical protein